MGKSGAAVLEAVLRSERRPLTRTDIAKCMGKQSRSIRKPLERLVEYGVLVESGAGYVLPDNWKHQLDRAAAESGAVAKGEQHCRQFELEREEYQAWLTYRAKRAARQEPEYTLPKAA